MKAVRIHEHGGPEVLRHEECPEPAPAQGEAVVKIEASGINFIDIYQRSGLYPMELPTTIGQEAAGIVAAVGDGVTEISEDDAVAYASVVGSYAELAVVPARQLVRLPMGLEPRLAAAVMLQGMTAQYLCRSAYPVQEGARVLMHAGAGGVGLLFIQIAKRLGAEVFATVSTMGKAQLAREAGADHVIRYVEEDFAQAVMDATRGEGVQAVYDSVGKTTFEKSLTCLAVRGHLVLFGQSSGPVGPLSPGILGQKSTFLTRPRLHHYTRTREELVQRADEVFRWVASGDLKVKVHKKYPLAQAAQAHEDLASRKTSGKLLLLP
jgi:NADPH2:quinone reductase